MTDPVFSRRIQVQQVEGGANGLWFLLPMALLMAPPLAGGAWFMDLDGWAGALGVCLCIALALAMCLIGLVAGFWFEGRLRAWRGKAPLFNEMTQVDIDENGITVDALGSVAWIDVLAIEGIPDSSSCLVVHTRPLRKLMMSTPLDELAHVIQHYMTQERSPPQDGRAPLLQVRAVVFSWRRFITWIWAGYALAGALGLLMLQNANNAGFFKTLVALGVLMPLSAWLVWMIPFAQLGMLAPGRTRAFELESAVLRSTDGAVRIDLRGAQAESRCVSGLGYDFSFVSIRSKNSARLDLLLDDAERHALLDALQECCRMSGANHANEAHSDLR
jgi:hypothetical protein